MKPKRKKTTKPAFVYATYIHTTPQKLWRALTDPKFIREYWMDRRFTATWEPGGVLESRSPEGVLEFHGKIVSAEPPWRLVYTTRGVGDYAAVTSRVAFEIETLDEHPHYDASKVVKLTITETGLDPASDIAKASAEGWMAILSGLKTLLETGRGLGIRHKG